MTTRGHRRTAPVLIGLTTGAVMAGVAVLLGPLHPPVEQTTTDAIGANLEHADPVPPPAAPPSTPPATPPPAVPAPAVPNPPAPTPPKLPMFLPGIPAYLPALMPGGFAPTAPAPVKKPALPLLSGPAAQVVSLTNRERARAGCGPLAVDPRLVLSAQRHSVDMARRHYFEHEDPEGHDFSDREAAAGFTGDSGGENIAMGQETAAEVMNDWMHSPGHRRNILDCSFTSIGVGYVPAGRYWTQNFGG